ncbi:hypothetical protein SPV2_gp41 [Sulfolobus polyhedral virus 2]|uniref:Uncharacterized protein n=1 Tax=Sulfolobus polyhedral virus 2 TaxID=2493125 RepID=A0A3S8NFN6_9VIRU|nr:hypothetical protein KM458_gp41 [Sulfolobus polyhedral virus 2]AZI76040.1 hypothetical protein SPV2_gp41 [Sulfolobus polyhedral virus 2]
MTVIDGVSVTDTPWLKRGWVMYASASTRSTKNIECGVGATLSACGTLPATSTEVLARWGNEARSSLLQEGVAHHVSIL